MEKIWKRMLFDRDPRWTIFADRVRVRDYVADKVGEGCLIPMLWTGAEPEELPFDELPSRFVIKTNHGAGYNIIVKDGKPLDRAKVIQQLTKWLGQNFCQDTGLGTEWAYRNIKPRIIVESFLDDHGRVPVDYKFFCYSGRAEFFKMDFDRFEEHTEAFFDRDLNRLDLFGEGIAQYRGKIVLPDNYGDMVRIAESLAQDIDFIRVDLYSVAGRVYFGELTCYHGAGMMKLCPRRYDFLFGEKWAYGERGRSRQQFGRVGNRTEALSG